MAERLARRAAFRSGAVMGFLLASTGLLVLWLTIHAFWLVCTDAWGRHVLFCVRRSIRQWSNVIHKDIKA